MPRRVKSIRQQVFKLGHQNTYSAVSLEIVESICSLDVHCVETAIIGGRILAHTLVLVGDVNFAKPRENGFQQLVLVLNHNEETRGVTK